MTFYFSPVIVFKQEQKQQGTILQPVDNSENPLGKPHFKFINDIFLLYSDKLLLKYDVLLLSYDRLLLKSDFLLPPDFHR